MKKYILLIILNLIILSSCYESEPISVGGKTIIYQLKDTTTYYTDTLILYGENLGIISDSSCIIINDTLKIPSKSCLYWTNSKIQIIVPMLPKYSTIYVIVNGKKIFYNGENYMQNIVVLPYPPFSSVLISSGNADIGSTEFDIPNEQPIHNIILTKDIIVSACEVSQRLYSIVMNSNPSTKKYDDYPVYNVNWLDAIHFCNQLSLLDSLPPVYTILESGYVSFDTTSNGWRIPTEAEWEYIANMKIKNEAELLEYAWFANNSALNPHSIGLLKPNQFGLYDILGNVWEWCWDWYRADYYSISPVVNPAGPLTGTEHIIRGGSCDDGKIIVRKEYRGIKKDDTKIGFRVVRNSN